MIAESDAELDSLLRSLAVSSDEAARQDVLKEKIKAQIASLFEENDTSKNHNEFCAG
jgi:hypothetical protein